MVPHSEVGDEFYLLIPLMVFISIYLRGDNSCIMDKGGTFLTRPCHLQLQYIPKIDSKCGVLNEALSFHFEGCHTKSFFLYIDIHRLNLFYHRCALSMKESLSLSNHWFVQQAFTHKCYDLYGSTTAASEVRLMNNQLQGKA